VAESSEHKLVKISERKQHLRRRGVVPVAQPEARAAKTVPSARKSATYTAGAAGSGRGHGGAGNSRAAAKGDAKGAPARPRRQVTARYQLTIGALYMTFAPLLLAFYVAQILNPKVKTHPGALELLMTVLFFLFGVWNVYRGLQARRKQAAEKAAAEKSTGALASSTAPTPTPMKWSRLLRGPRRSST